MTQTLTERAQTRFLKASVAQAAREQVPLLPDFVIGYLHWYDTMQFWLIDQAVCMRHQEHKVFHLHLQQVFPSREIGEHVRDDAYPILAGKAVGVLAWVLPHINILDEHGLNDYTIARHSTLSPGGLMAHERQPPAGYIECFAPNVVIRPREDIIILAPLYSLYQWHRWQRAAQSYRAPGAGRAACLGT
jgi:arabinofuranosyltransferase